MYHCDKNLIVIKMKNWKFIADRVYHLDDKFITGKIYHCDEYLTLIKFIIIWKFNSDNIYHCDENL